MIRQPLLAKNLRVTDTGGGYGMVEFVDKPIPFDANAEVEQMDYESTGFCWPCGESVEELERYLPGNAYRLRAWLIHESLREGCFYVGRDRQSGVRCTSAKQVAAALRRWYPLRDYTGTGDDEQDEQAVALESKVSPIRPSSAREWFHTLSQNDPDFSPGRLT